MQVYTDCAECAKHSEKEKRGARVLAAPWALSASPLERASFTMQKFANFPNFANPNPRQLPPLGAVLWDGPAPGPQERPSCAGGARPPPRGRRGRRRRIALRIPRVPASKNMTKITDKKYVRPKITAKNISVSKKLLTTKRQNLLTKTCTPILMLEDVVVCC